MNKPIPITPHAGDHMRDAFHQWRNPNRIEIAVLFVTGAILAAVALAIIVNQ